MCYIDNCGQDREGAMKLEVHVHNHCCGCQCHKCKPPKPSHKVGYIIWTLGPVQEQKFKGPAVRSTKMTQLSETQFVEGVVEPVTSKGSPAQVQTSVFSSSDENVLKVESSEAEPLKVKVIAQKPGAAQVQWKADADLGDGVVEITAVADFTVVAGMAVGANFSFGTPQEQPPAEPPTP